MRRRLSCILGGFLLLLAGTASAQQVIQLSPEALNAVRQQSESLAPFQREQREGLELRGNDPRERTGISYHGGGVFIGRFAFSVSPVANHVGHWVFKQGLFVNRLGDRYAGAFYFFHEAYTVEGRKPSKLPENGQYIMVGTEMRHDGKTRTGIFQADLAFRSTLKWIPADKEWLAAFEADRQKEVASVMRKIRREKAAARSQAASGFSFGQVLALGLGATGLAMADIPAADALQIGTAFASDVLTEGKTSALNDYVGNKRPELPASPSAAASASGVSSSGLPSTGLPGAAPVASSPAASAYTSEKVSISCPSGSGPHSIPLYYKTQSCRSAMLNYAKVYACNLIDDMQSAAQRCESDCGHIQCMEQ
tara:strand:+ start:2530 stop:3627 length:1098 start_codon:yes stop_codon:yes gene_type:complete